MAKLPKGIFGPISGKLGPLIGASWKGISYVRMTPKQTGRAKTLSEKQKAHHVKFGFFTKWFKPFHPFVTLGFRHLAEGTTEINAAFSYNYGAALTGQHPNYEIDYAKVLLSKGELPTMNSPQLTRIAPNEIRLDWEENSVFEKFGYDDQLMMVLYSRELQLADGLSSGTKRAKKTCTVTFNSKLANYDLDVYVSFCALNGKEVSNSQYRGKIAAL